MTNKQLLKKYDKITDDICTIGDTGGTNSDAHYCNKQGALQDWYELEEIGHLNYDEEVNNDDVNDICERLDKALIVAKAIDKINKLEDIISKNMQYA
tara:strand:- start:712 stop:1002 length:291 start_codon:yes stop_codon:yes gene_type:complete